MIPGVDTQRIFVGYSKRGLHLIGGRDFLAGGRNLDLGEDRNYIEAIFIFSLLYLLLKRYQGRSMIMIDLIYGS